MAFICLCFVCFDQGLGNELRKSRKDSVSSTEIENDIIPEMERTHDGNSE